MRPPQRQRTIGVINRCEPARSYLVRCLQEVTDTKKIVAFANVTQWFQAAKGCKRPKVILICNFDDEHQGGAIARELSPRENHSGVPVFWFRIPTEPESAR